MKSVTLSINEKALDAGQQYAVKRGLSLDALVEELLAKTSIERGAQAIEKFLETVSRAHGASNGTHWTRDELYNV